MQQSSRQEEEEEEEAEFKSSKEDEETETELTTKHKNNPTLVYRTHPPLEGSLQVQWSYIRSPHFPRPLDLFNESLHCV